MKIKFCSHGYTVSNYYTTLNPSWIFLKTWYDLHGLNKNVTWLKSEILVFDDPETIVKNIIKEAPDVLGLGVYIWNETLQMYIAKKVKQALPNTVIVMGGPQLAVHRNDVDPEELQDDFFIKHPYIDYSVYGDGEKPFQQIIDYVSGYIKNKDEFVNIVENNNGKRKIYPFEVLTDELYLSTSPYVNNKELIKQQIEFITSKGVPKDNQIWAMEFARGCMYSCSFCDWSQNLTKKIARRTHDWRKDLELWREFDVAIRETDANFGQWKEDIEIYDYALQLSKDATYFKFPVSNTSKLKKDATAYIQINNSIHYNDPVKISFQDTDENVLSAINRPSVSWAKIVETVERMERELPDEKFAEVTAELILGLPGQTFDGFVNNFSKLFEIKISNFNVHTWWYLPNAPATDPMYKKLWGVKLKKQYSVLTNHASPEHYVKVESLDQLYEGIAETEEQYVYKFLGVPTIFQTKDMSFVDMMASRLVLSYYNTYKLKQPLLFKRMNTEKFNNMLEIFKKRAQKEAKSQWELHEPLVEKYGFVVWGSYDMHNKILHGDF